MTSGWNDIKAWLAALAAMLLVLGSPAASIGCDRDVCRVDFFPSPDGGAVAAAQHCACESPCTPAVSEPRRPGAGPTSLPGGRQLSAAGSPALGDGGASVMSRSGPPSAAGPPRPRPQGPIFLANLALLR